MVESRIGESDLVDEFGFWDMAALGIGSMYFWSLGFFYRVGVRGVWSGFCRGSYSHLCIL